MPRQTWSLHAFQLIVPDDQLDLFACREARLHLVARQLELGVPADRTLCGSLLPASPLWLPLAAADLRDPRLCNHCHAALQAARQRRALSWQPA
jgi:hypothetical protein